MQISEAQLAQVVARARQTERIRILSALKPECREGLAPRSEADHLALIPPEIFDLEPDLLRAVVLCLKDGRRQRRPASWSP